MARASRWWVKWAIGWGALAVVMAGAVVGLYSSPRSTGGGRVATHTTAAWRPGAPGTSSAVAGPAHVVAGSSATDKARVAPAPVAGGVAAPEPAPGLGVVEGLRVIKSATLSVEVPRGGFQDRFQRAAAIASAHNGFVAGSTSERHGRVQTGYLELRVPAAGFEAVRHDLSALGRVTDQQLSGDDVSGQVIDLDARMRSLSAEEDALRALLAQSRTVSDTIQIQQQLVTVRQQIEELAAQKARLDDATAMSTVTVNLAEPGVTSSQPPRPSRLGASARMALDGAGAVLGGTLVVLGYVLPLGVLGLLGWSGWRLAVRRRPAVAG